MFRSNFHSVVGVLVASLPCFLFAKNILVDDFTGGDNQNNFEYYWYYYDDNMLPLTWDRPQVDPVSKPSIINVPYTVSERHWFGDARDTYKVKNYTFVTGKSSDNEFATMPFTFGDPWEPDYCSKGKKCALPYVGLVTMLAKEGSWVDLTGVTAFRFKMRSKVQSLQVRFIVRTFDIEAYANKPTAETIGDEFGYYGYYINLEPGDWQTFMIPVSDLALPGIWAHEFDFTIKKCTKFVWEVLADGRQVNTSDTVDLDDVWILGELPEYPVSNDPWCRSSLTRPAGGMVADFEAAPHEKPPFGAPWHAFTDLACDGNSKIGRGASYDSFNRRYKLEWIENTGSFASAYAPFIEAEIGKKVRKYPLTGDTLMLKGFAGIACNVYDSSSATYLDLTKGRFGGMVAPGPSGSIRFDYLLDGAGKFTLELLDVNDVPDRINPNRHESRGAGNVWHHEICGSPTWKSVEIPFDSLHLWNDCAWCIPVPFDKSRVALIRFKVEGSEGLGCLLAIDNVYFPSYTPTGASSMTSPQLTAAPAIKVYSRYGSIRINMPSEIDYSGRTVSVLDPRGRVVARHRLSGRSGAQFDVPAKVKANGLYFIRFDGGIQKDGRQMFQPIPITIVR